MAGSGVISVAPVATPPVIRALLDQARDRNFRTGGVLGIRARPEWTGLATFVHQDLPVRVVPCVSALAVREALLDRPADGWLVVLTDRSDQDLGSGVLSHLVWQRLRTPDPWDAVRARFAATGIDARLTGDRDIATGMLAAIPAEQYPPAPGGILTADHALGTVARIRLNLDTTDLDAAAVLAWTVDPAGIGLIADLRRDGGDPLTDAVLEWAVRPTGGAAIPLLHLLRGGEGPDVVPLGVVAGLLIDPGHGSGENAQIAREALIRLELRMGGALPATAALASWASESSGVVRELLHSDAERGAGERSLARADVILSGSRGVGLAHRSELLPSGLTARLAGLAAAVLRAVADVDSSSQRDCDGPQVTADALTAVEAAWAGVATHLLFEGDRRVRAFRAAVRLVRWLAGSTPAAVGELDTLVQRHRDADAWADSAINDAASGVGDPELGAALAAVIATARRRRDAHDTAFATALAEHTAANSGLADGGHGGVWHLEDVLPQVVLPLAKATPVLLLVLDGMSVGVCTEVIAKILERAADGWAEALLANQLRRAAALAVLPTLTDVSRASLLCGKLCTGGQDVEQRGYAELTRAHRFPTAPLFHKKPLDSSPSGYALAHDVRVAVDDIDGQRLVTCVLNTIDDALDRSDPGGTEWSADAVKHLAPLLERAHRAGRVVVLTADHGHVVERREGVQRSHTSISSGRSRSADQPAGESEIEVAGRRVLRHDGRAVLAVNERLRYGPLKAGYHGGASPAEVLVPVAVLVPGAVPPGTDLRLAPPQEPAWWATPLAPVSPLQVPSPPVVMTVPRPKASTKATRAPATTPTLFDGLTERADPPAAAQSPGTTIAGGIVASSTYASQKKLARRVSTDDAQVLALLDALLRAPDHRLSPTRAATALGVAPSLLRGAVSHVQQLLNVEGYAVLRVDADGATVILDKGLLDEQFGASS